MSLFDEKLNCFIPHKIGDTISTPYGPGILKNVKRESDGKSEILFDWGTVIMNMPPQVQYLGIETYAISLFRTDLGEVMTHFISNDYILQLCKSHKGIPQGLYELSEVNLQNYRQTLDEYVYYISLKPIYRPNNMDDDMHPYAIQLSSRMEAQWMENAINEAKERYFNENVYNDFN